MKRLLWIFDVALTTSGVNLFCLHAISWTVQRQKRYVCYIFQTKALNWIMPARGLLLMSIQTATIIIDMRQNNLLYSSRNIMNTGDLGTIKSLYRRCNADYIFILVFLIAICLNLELYGKSARLFWLEACKSVIALAVQVL